MSEFTIGTHEGVKILANSCISKVERILMVGVRNQVRQRALEFTSEREERVKIMNNYFSSKVNGIAMEAGIARLRGGEGG